MRLLLCCAAVALVCLTGSAPRAGAGTLGPVAERLATAAEAGDVAGALRAARAHRARVSREDHADRVSVILEPRAGRRPVHVDAARVAVRGGTVEARSRSFVRVRIRPRDLRLLASHPEAGVVRMPTPQVVDFGGVVSESVQLTFADTLHTRGITGTGVRAAVIDVGFDTLDAAIAAGELPSGTVVGVLPGQTAAYVKSGDHHGVGVAEHLVDMAPGVELHVLRTDDELDLENAGDYLVAHGIDVAVHAVGWVNRSYYDDTGPISGVVNAARDSHGVFWVNSAGNSRRKHWHGPWTDTDGDRLLEFDPGVEQIEITGSSGDVCIHLNWDQYGQQADNLDLYIRDGTGSRILASTGSQGGGADPAESICFDAGLFTAPFSLEVERHVSASPPPGLDVTVFSFWNKLTPRSVSGSFMDPAAAHGAYTACAISAQSYEDASPWPETFSARGPTKDGRSKPDLCAPNRTQSLTYGTSTGTSFAAPTIGGAAALLLEMEPTLTADEMRAYLDAVAWDTRDPGWDIYTGHGRLSLERLTGPRCDDLLDNDDDGLVDLADPGCGGNPGGRKEAPQCNDGEDNDLDGLVDLDDPTCGGNPAGRKEGAGCGLGFEIAGALLALAALRRRRRGP